MAILHAALFISLSIVWVQYVWCSMRSMQTRHDDCIYLASSISRSYAFSIKMKLYTPMNSDYCWPNQNRSKEPFRAAVELPSNKDEYKQQRSCTYIAVPQRRRLILDALTGKRMNLVTLMLTAIPWWSQRVLRGSLERSKACSSRMARTINDIFIMWLETLDCWRQQRMLSNIFFIFFHPFHFSLFLSFFSDLYLLLLPLCYYYALSFRR